MGTATEFEGILDQFYRIIQLASSDPALRNTLLDFLRMSSEHQVALLKQHTDSHDTDLKAALGLLRHPGIALMAKRYFEA